jgi:hypothetical protein
MKQLSILIALILVISANVQAKKYKVFYSPGNVEHGWFMNDTI